MTALLDRPWTHKESLFLAQSHEQCGLPWCASQLRRTVEDCVARLKELGVAEGPEWIDIGTAGRLASCSGSTIRALAVAGTIEGRKTRIGRWEVKRGDVLAYAAEHQRVTEESGLEVAKGYVRPKRSHKKLKDVPVRLVEAREGGSAEKMSAPKQGDASEGILEAKNGMSPETPAGYITVEEYAEAAGVSRKIAMRRCWEGRVSCVKHGRKWLVSETEAVIAKPREEREPDRCVSRRALGEMSRLDILRALASGAMVGGLRG